MTNEAAYVVHLNEQGTTYFFNKDKKLKASEFYDFYKKFGKNVIESNDEQEYAEPNEYEHFFEISPTVVLTSEKHLLEPPIAAIVFDDKNKPMMVMVENEKMNVIDVTLNNSDIDTQSEILQGFGRAAQKLNMAGLKITTPKNAMSSYAFAAAEVFTPIKTLEKEPSLFCLLHENSTYKYQI